MNAKDSLTSQEKQKQIQALTLTNSYGKWKLTNKKWKLLLHEKETWS
jgi:hypothetical protein